MVNPGRNQSPASIVLLVGQEKYVHRGFIVRPKTSEKRDDSICGEGQICVQLYSRRASLVNEFRLDKQEHNLADIAAAEAYLRRTMAPCDLASTTVTLISNEGTDHEEIVQFDPQQN